MPTHTLQLTGLNGNNPLAFLAALGAFRTAQQLANSEIRLGWTALKNSWFPFLQGKDDCLADKEFFLATISDILNCCNPAFKIGKNLSLPVDRFYVVVTDALTDWFNGRTLDFVDFVAAFGNESRTNDNGDTEDTAFRFLRHFSKETDKKGNKTAPGFLDVVRELVATTTQSHLSEALFGPWKFNDMQCSFRWAPDDDRRYALRWMEPSKDPARNVRGANRLAVEGLPLYPTMPTVKAIETTGFRGHTSSNMFFTWPLWAPPITLDVCRSLLAHAELQKENPAMERLNPVGIIAVLRSKRIIPDKYYKNFAPAVSVGKF
jgi:hypothetical protein